MLVTCTRLGAVIILIVSGIFMTSTATAQSASSSFNQNSSFSIPSGPAPSDVPVGKSEQYSKAEMHQMREVFEAFVREELGETAYPTLEQRASLRQKFQKLQTSVTND